MTKIRKALKGCGISPTFSIKNNRVCYRTDAMSKRRIVGITTNITAILPVELIIMR